MRWRAIIRWAALIAAAAAAAIAANVVLLGVAESRDDPVGRLTPRVVVEDAGPPASQPGSGTRTTPAETVVSDDDGDRADDNSADTETDDSHADEPGEEDDD